MPIMGLLKETIRTIESDYLDKTERVFSYELYYRFKTNLIKHNIIDETKLVLDAELPKKRLSEEEANNLGLLDLGKLMSPDIILHERDTANQQLLVGEIKTSKSLTRKNLIQDIKKLISLKMNYSFEHAVFILVNGTIDKIEHFLNHNNTNILYNNNDGDDDDENTIIIPDNINIQIYTIPPEGTLCEHSLVDILP